MLPRIVTSPTAVGFHWADPAGVPRRLLDLFGEPGAEPHRWVPTHLEALDDVLVDLTGRCGEVLGGGRPPSPEEVVILRRGYREIDRLTVEYDDARRAAGLPEATRAGQIVGSAALLSVHARTRLGLMGPVPFDGELDAPPPGVVGGRAGLHWVDPAHPWLGARWLVVTDPAPGEPPARLPASLSMLLTDSSRVDPVASRREHREALGQVTAAVGDKGAATTDPGGDDRSGATARASVGRGVEPLAASGALDWLLYDWLMAHRDGPDSPAVTVPGDPADPARAVADAELIVSAAATSARLRASFDPCLLDLPAPV